MQRDVLGIGEHSQQLAVFLVQPQVHRHYALVPLWYRAGRQDSGTRAPTEIARYAVLIGPVLAYLVTKRICLGLQRKDLLLIEHAVAGFTGTGPAAVGRHAWPGS